MNLLAFEQFDACYHTDFDGIELTQILPGMNVHYAPYQRPMLKWFSEQCRKHGLNQGRDFVVRYDVNKLSMIIHLSPACAYRLIEPFGKVSQLARDMLFELQRYADATGRLTLDADGNSMIVDGPPITAPE